MSAPKKGDKVRIQGFLCEVLSTGTCEDSFCGKPIVTIIDPEGQEDTVHLEDCDGEVVP